MTAHIHSELMMQYAQDAMETNTPWELWEWRKANSNGLWDELETNPTWCEYNEYRRKPRTININGHEVPEPLREPLEYDEEYYVVDLDSLYFCGVWDNHKADERRLKLGLIHLTKEAAIAHAKALLSFTAKPEANNE